MTDGRRWIALYTKANQEEIAVENIVRQEFEAYCPVITRVRRHARKVQQVRRPLFPSYVFVRLNARRDPWRPLLSTRGVRSLVRFGERVATLPDGFVDALKSSEATGDLHHQLVAPRLSPGDHVRLTDGPFQNLIARVLSLPDKDRVWVLLDFMGQEVRVSQPLSGLIP